MKLPNLRIRLTMDTSDAKAKVQDLTNQTKNTINATAERTKGIGEKLIPKRDVINSFLLADKKKLEEALEGQNDIFSRIAVELARTNAFRLPRFTTLSRGMARGAFGGGAEAVGVTSGGFGGAAFGAAVGAGAGVAVIAIQSILMGIEKMLRDFGKIMLESSGYLKAVSNLMNIAVMNILRPIGDAIGMILLPAMMRFVQETSRNYALMLKAVESGKMDIITAVIGASGLNAIAIGRFIVNVILSMINAIYEVGKTLIPLFADVIATALDMVFVQRRPEAIEAASKPFTSTALMQSTMSFPTPFLLYESYKALTTPSREERPNQIILNISGNIFGVDDLNALLGNALNRLGVR